VRSTTPKELNIKQLSVIIHIQFFQNCEIALCFSADFIYGYSYSIPSEFWVCYFLFAPLHLCVSYVLKLITNQSPTKQGSGQNEPRHSIADSK
jgi:hypothetical protein